VGTGVRARPSRAKLGSCPCPRHRSIRHAGSWIALLFLFAAVCSADVLRVAVNDAIQPVTAEYIGRALAAAAANHDQAVLIEINTPGGLVDSTREIIEKIVASPVPVIIYVTPSGSRAASAGFFILECGDVAAMAPGTNTGAAHPVILGEKMDDVMKMKMENDAAALMRSVVAKRGRNVELAESAVRESKSFTDQEALDKKLIEYIASSEQDLFHQLNGKSFKRFDGTTVTLNLQQKDKGEPVRDYRMTLKERILSYLMDPNVAFILLAIGALALYAEFNHPGAVIPGTVGVVFILLAAFALNLRHCPVDAGRPVSGRCAHPRNARPPRDRAIRQHPARTYHGLPDEHRRARAPQQDCHRQTRIDRRNRNRANHAGTVRKSVRARRALGRRLHHPRSRRRTNHRAASRWAYAASRSGSGGANSHGVEKIRPHLSS
jgi:ATP-dependent protease ClpP protease subunit